MKFVEIDCPVCSGNDYVIVFPDTLGENPPVFGYKWTPDIRKTYRIVRCEHCSHMYCSPRPLDMYAHYQDVADDSYLQNENLRTETAKRVVRTIRDFVLSGRLLDVGCSTGDFLAVAQENFQAEGIELSEWAVKIAEGRGLNVMRRTLAEMTEVDDQYDVVTLWGVIEHLEYPQDELRRINHLVKPGGLVCLWTGDSNSIPAKVFGHKWWYILGQHIQYFSKRSLDKLMENAGFQRAHIGIYPYVISLDYLGTSLSRYPIFGVFANRILSTVWLRHRKLTMKLPGEIFGIYRKAEKT